jgi:rhodanese-related sulfurtransferase
LVLARLQQLAIPKDEPVLVHCRSGARSLRVMPQILAYGFAEVYHLPGGILSWLAAGLPVEAGPSDPG